MPDKVTEVLPQQDVMEHTTTAKLAGKEGVFVGGDDDLAAAKARYEAMKAVEDGSASLEQRQLLSDLDRVMQGARARAQQQATPVPPAAPPAPPPPVPVPPRRPVAPPRGMPAPPRHSRHR